MSEPIRVTGTLHPISVNEIKPGVYIFDMGQNMVGWCRLHVSGPAGTRIILRHAETLKPDGSLYMANLRGARQTDSYILKGDGEEIWEPRFTSHGFRYVEVTGFPGKPDLNSIEGRVVNDDLPAAGEFECSNELLNQIYRAIVWGVRGNYRSIPTDCPQRDERQGWLGDRSEESRGESFCSTTPSFTPDGCRTSPTRNDRAAACPTSRPPTGRFIPTMSSGRARSVIVPEMLREQFDDTQTIARQYDSAKKWMDYMSRWLTNGIISRDSYGDWCVPPEDLTLIHSKDPNRDHGQNTARDLVFLSRFQADGTLRDNARQNRRRPAISRTGRKIKVAFNEKFLDRDNGQYSNGTQTSCVCRSRSAWCRTICASGFSIISWTRLKTRPTDTSAPASSADNILCRVLTDNGRAGFGLHNRVAKRLSGLGLHD